MPRFAIGELVELNGVLGEIGGIATGKVVSIVPHKDGVSGLDEYEIVFGDSPPLRFCRFQLTHVGGPREAQK